MYCVTGNIAPSVCLLMKHVMAATAGEGVYSLEFSLHARRRILSVSYWEGKQLVCMPIVSCGRDVQLSKSFVVLTSRL